MSLIDKPNVVLPLAASYNTRGVDAFTNVYTNSWDQRKVNMQYEITQNSVTQNSVVYTVKRHGINRGVSTSTFGVSSQVAHQISLKAQALGAVTVTIGNDPEVWVYSVSTNAIIVSDFASTVTVTTLAGYAPVYVKKTHISAVDTAVLQIRNASNVNRLYYASTLNTWTDVTTATVTSLSLRGNAEFMDGYGFVLASDNYIYSSNLNTLDVWSPNDRILKQIVQDPPTALARLNNQILAFGVETMEVFANRGNPTGSPLESVRPLHQRIGLFPATGTSGKNYYAVIGNKLFFYGTLGGRSQAQRVFAYDGQNVERVSTPFIEKILNRSGQDVNGITSFQTRGQYGVAVHLDLATSSTQRWLMFFPDYKEWFEWNSNVFKPLNNGTYWLGTGTNSNKLYTFGDVNNWQDDGGTYTALMQFKLPANGTNTKVLDMYGVIGATTPTATTSNLNVTFTEDDWQTSTSVGTIDMTQMKKTLYRGGAFSELGVGLSHSDNCDLRLEKFVARVRE